MIYRISKKAAGIGIISANIFTVLVFLSVILKILPYNSISGGRLDSYQAAYQTAIVSILLTIFGIPVTASASELIKIGRFKNFFKIWLVFAIVLIAFLLYESAFVGVIIVIFGMPLVAIASGLIKYRHQKIFLKAYFWFSFILLCLNTIANLMGITIFEKIIMTLVTVVQAVFFFRLATDNGSTDNTDLRKSTADR